jgi:hypothetical protein
MRRRAFFCLVALISVLAVAGPVHAAKRYNDPWLEGDLQQMRVPDALDILARTPQRVIVGDVDSGARLTDPDLIPHLLRMSRPYTCASAYGSGPSYGADPANGDFGCDFIGSGEESTPSTAPDGDPTDPSGHGTGTAAIIAAVPNNGLEGAGVAPNARVLPVRACYGGNPDCLNEPALDGLQYAVAMGARVVNASWPPEGLSQGIYDFVHSNANVLFVFAIGGTGQNSDPYTLCTDKTAYPNVLCVGLANPDDSVGTDDANTTTDVSAPGNAGVPTAAGARGEFGHPGGAAAHVSGAAALLRGVAPDLTAAQIANVLVTTSRTVAGYATANRAKGIVDVAAAVRMVQGMDGLVTPAEGHGAAADSPDPFPAAGGGGSASPPVNPSITDLRESNRRWREGSALASISRHRAPVGTVFAFSLNETAKLSLSFSQKVAGHRSHHRCRRGGTRHRSLRCTALVNRGSFSLKGHAATNRIRFQGKISKHKRLPVGSYQVTLTATNSLGHRTRHTINFTIVR